MVSTGRRSLAVLVVWALAAAAGQAPAQGAGVGAAAGYADKSLAIEGFAQMRWQLDHRAETGAAVEDTENYFRLRRLRLRATGDWNRYFRVRIQLALQELAKSNVAAQVLEDGFIRIKRSDAVEFHFGQYKMPISREELRSSAEQLVVDRGPIVNDNFLRSQWISRDIGLMFAGNLYGHDVPFEYFAGVWNGEGRNRPADFRDPNDAKIFGGRAEYSIVPGLEVAGALLANPILSGGGRYTFGDSSFSIPDSVDYNEMATVWNVDGNFTHSWERRRLIVEGEVLQGTNTRVFADQVQDSVRTGGSLAAPGDEGFTQRGMQVSSQILFRTAAVLTGWEVGLRVAQFDPNVDADDNATNEVAVALGLHFLDEPEINKDRLQLEYTNLSYQQSNRDDDWSLKAQWQVRY